MGSGAGSAAFRVAVDIGGTFTDLVAFDEANRRTIQAKALTTPHQFSQGIWDCLEKAGIAPAVVTGLVHGSTIAINIAIQGTGAKTALLTTQGTRDVYAIGRQNRPNAYDFAFTQPTPLVPRSRTLEVTERLSASGEVLTALDRPKLDAVVEELAALEPEAVAICLLHSYASPEHERAVAARVRARLPGAYVTASVEISREFREYERTSTTVMNAYIGPSSRDYIESIEQRLHAGGFAGHFMIMQSNGGVMSSATAKELPVAMMESGPVGGVIAAAEVGSRLGYANVLSFDMGGTTAKVSMIRDGEVAVAKGYHVGFEGFGHPVNFPVVDIVEIGAGGGSIAWIDQIGALKLGPRSASSVPGPVCYGRGGTEPTVTDANVALGRIGTSSLLGGEMTLDKAGAEAAIAARVGDVLNLATPAAADGILQIAIAKMALAARRVSVERGHDPRDFVMLATGGAGPLHAVALARELHVPTVIIPVFPGHFSALGMLLADVRHDYVLTHYRKLDDADLGTLDTAFGELAAEGDAALAAAHVAPADRASRWSMDIRYVGQESFLNVPVEAAEIRSRDTAAISDRFHAVHQARYGHSAPDEPTELVNIRVAAIGRRSGIEFPVVGGVDAAPRARRSIHMSDPARPVDTPIYDRESLAAGQTIAGPCIIEEYASSTVVFERDSVTVAPSGELIITVTPND